MNNVKIFILIFWFSFLLRGNDTEIKKYFYPTGELKKEIIVQKGIKNGEIKIYYKSGKLIARMSIDEHGLNGPSEFYYENGILESIINFNNNLMDGIQKRFYESGKLSSIAFYKIDKPIGLSLDFFESGKIASECVYDNEKSNESTYYETGEMQIKKTYEGDFNIISFVGFLKNGNKLNGKINCKFNSGNIDFTGNFENGQPDQIFRSYFESGKLAYEGLFLKGKANGIHKIYSENGKVIFKIPYKNGKVDGIVEISNALIEELTKRIAYINGIKVKKK